jgi:hypothetical protein
MELLLPKSALIFARKSVIICPSVCFRSDNPRIYQWLQRNSHQKNFLHLGILSAPSRMNIYSRRSRFEMSPFVYLHFRTPPILQTLPRLICFNKLFAFFRTFTPSITSPPNMVNFPTGAVVGIIFGVINVLLTLVMIWQTRKDQGETYRRINP